MTCVHHWRLATPAGPVVDGCCIKCGATRAYRSFEEVSEDTGYNGHISRQSDALRRAAVAAANRRRARMVKVS